MSFKAMKSIKEDFKNTPVELYGNKRVLIADCKSVIDYSENSIALDLGELKIKISGKKLVCDSFVYGQTDITGLIEKVEFI